jgi:hypothetical protein
MLSVVTPQVDASPALTWRMASPRTTRIGLVLQELPERHVSGPVSVPTPSSPVELLPQQ